MSTSLTLTATEARRQFFRLLQEVGEGKEAFIIKKDTGRRYKLSLASKKERPNKKHMLQKLAKINIPPVSIGEIKKILQTRYDDILP